MVKGARNTASWVLGSTSVQLQLYKSLVRCRVEYCCPLWKVEDIQFAGLQNLNYWQRLSKLKLLSLQRRRERYMIIHVWKILSRNAPNDVNMEFRQNSRLGIRVKIPPFSRTAPQAVTRLYDESFAVHAGKLWNILPSDRPKVGF